jgi:hypothetical protein
MSDEGVVTMLKWTGARVPTPLGRRHPRANQRQQIQRGIQLQCLVGGPFGVPGWQHQRRLLHHPVHAPLPCRFGEGVA